MTTALKNGQITLDQRLDLVFHKDERSREYPVTAAIPTQKPRSYTWKGGPVTDQGREGACAGHGWTGALTARPRARTVADPARYASEAYHEMQHDDPWDGCALGPNCTVAPSAQKYDGTSVLAGAKLLQKRGAVAEYRWAFGLSDLVLALGYKGPVVLGIPWYESMYEAPNGKVTVAGAQVGGHCLLARGVDTKARTVLLRNSWGPDWGIGGDARITYEQLDRLLKEGGEACIPCKTPTR